VKPILTERKAFPMKPRVALLTLLCLALLAVPAVAGKLYDNGPINGTVDAWTINFGYVVSDSFTLSSNNATATSIEFGAWLFPGDTLSTVEASVTSQPNSGQIFFDQVLNTTQSGCATNQGGFDVCTINIVVNWSFGSHGTYWLNLQNAVAGGDPAFWDENSGIGCTSLGCPSQAYDSVVGTIPSEAFSISGTTTPEPSSVMLFGSGILGLAGMLRRKW
jgi:hypothetical protein